MSSGGGKGGSSSSVQEIPKWMEEPAIRNIARAEDIQRMGYMPWYGPDVAAFNPTQEAAAQANIGAAEAFGLIQPESLTAYQGMPQAETYAGGVQGYSAAPMFEQGVETLREKQPGTMAQYDALFGAGTQPGGGGSITGPTFSEQVGSGNYDSYSNYNPSTGNYGIVDGGDASEYVMDDGSINWGAAGNPDYVTIDGVGVTNPDGFYGSGGSGQDLGGFVGGDGGIDWNAAGNPDYGVVDGVGVTNPDGGYGYGGGSSGGGSSDGGDLGGSVGSDGSVDFGGNDYGTVDGVGVENPDSGGSSGGGGGGGGGSYIATASTQALGEDGLSVFNNWRDYMASWHPTFTSSFGRYRVTAPKIVDAIDAKENSKDIYRDIWDTHLKPIYDLIVKDRDDIKALSKYKVMVKDLAKKHLKEKV